MIVLSQGVRDTRWHRTLDYMEEYAIVHSTYLKYSADEPIRVIAGCHGDRVYVRGDLSALLPESSDSKWHTASFSSRYVVAAPYALVDQQAAWADRDKS